MGMVMTMASNHPEAAHHQISSHGHNDFVNNNNTIHSLDDSMSSNSSGTMLIPTTIPTIPTILTAPSTLSSSLSSISSTTQSSSPVPVVGKELKPMTDHTHRSHHSRLARCSSSPQQLSSLTHSKVHSARSRPHSHSHSHSHPHSHSCSHRHSHPDLVSIFLCSQYPNSHSYSTGTGPNSVLWKAYSRVKQSIAETHSTNPLETMTEYWHSLSSPRRRDLQQHQSEKFQEKTQDMELCVDTMTQTGHLISALPSASPAESTCSDSAYSLPDKEESNNSNSNSSSSNNNNMMMTLKPTTPSYALLQSVQSSATEHGRILAERSRSSFNRLLDSVLDNATTLAESNAVHESYSEEEVEKNKKKESQKQSKTQQQIATVVRKAKFFVGDSSDEEDENGEEEREEEEEIKKKVTYMRPSADSHSLRHLHGRESRGGYHHHHHHHLRHHHHHQESHDGDCEDFDITEQDDDDEAFYFGKPPRQLMKPSVPRDRAHSHSGAPSSPAIPRPYKNASIVLQRRQSLLSDLLMAEKQQKQQQKLLLQQQQQQQLQSLKYQYPIGSNTDGEANVIAQVSRMANVSDVNAKSLHSLYPTSSRLQQQQQYHSQQRYHQDTTKLSIQEEQEDDDILHKTKSTLVRTKKIYKNLAELAKTAEIMPSSNRVTFTTSSPTMASFIAKTSSVLPLPPSSTTISMPLKTPGVGVTASGTTTTATTTATTTGWTPSQVQGQTSSLVAQSTMTAQRALLNASTTLTDVLFRRR
ncbi:hypothetical protein BX616_004756 [Lobosporangium transversale]|nr:hypothetical protein BX616_004756 [Lobosporangium transversale]